MKILAMGASSVKSIGYHIGEHRAYVCFFKPLFLFEFVGELQIFTGSCPNRSVRFLPVEESR